MVFWMKKSARGLGRELQGRLDGALSIGAIALISTAFFAVAREGLETAIFIYANFRTVRSNTAPSLGLLLGLLCAVLLGTLLYKKTISINLSKFFTVTGYGLVVVAAGVLSHGINEFQSRGSLPGGSAFAWNFETSAAHGGRSAIWTLIDGSIGIGPSLTWLQLGMWSLYLFCVIGLYRRAGAAANSKNHLAVTQ
jgi:high-affinity iron transporter